jgi:hypothetical protein
VVWNEMNRADLESGMRPLKQEYQENIAAAKTRAYLTAVERLRFAACQGIPEETCSGAHRHKRPAARRPRGGAEAPAVADPPLPL